MANAPHKPEPHEHKPERDPRQDSDKPYRPEDPAAPNQRDPDENIDQKRQADQRANEARKLFDENERDDLPVTTQTDQLRRSMEMEQVGPTAWMNEQERRIRERQGDPPDEPRQVHGVAPVQRPR